MIAGIFDNELRITLETEFEGFCLNRLVGQQVEINMVKAPAGNAVLVIKKKNYDVPIDSAH